MKKHYRLSNKDKEYFTANLTLLLRAGVPVSEALVSLKDTAKSDSLRNLIGQMIMDVDEGMPLWKVLERSKNVPTQTLVLVRLGEQSGNLVENLTIAAEQEEKQRIFHSKVKSALMYPGFVFTMTLIVGLAVMWFLLPKLSETFMQIGVKLPLISKIFINAGLFIKTNGYWALPLVLGLFLLTGYVLFVHPKTKFIGQHILRHIPGISRLLHEVEIARFGYLLGTLLKAGLPVNHAVKLLQSSTPDTKYQLFYKSLSESLENGYGFQTSLNQYHNTNKLLPPAVQQMIVAGERSGALPETLLVAGGIYEKKADLTTQNLEVILEPILLVIVWLAVMGVAIAVILPIYSLVGGLN